MNQKNNASIPHKKYYFTYGSDPAYPFQGGWTLIYAPNLRAAQQIFKAYHPNRPGSDALNCADYYSASLFEQFDPAMKGHCHEIIMAMPAIRCESPDCAYVNPNGICLYALAHETMPDMECENGCSGYCEGPKTNN